MIRYGRISRMLDEAARLTGQRRRDIVGPCRERPLAYARFAVARAARRQSYSYGQIARHLGRVDHTTIMHAERRADELYANDPDFRELCDAVEVAA